MSGIPVYTQSPITATKASGVTPQTQAPPSSISSPSKPGYAPATTTATSSSTYPLAQPGASVAAPMPAPTSSASQRYSPVQAISTTKTAGDVPPAPQPGAFPTPEHSLRSNLPPPPKSGEHYQPPQPSMPQPYPPQMAIPPPTNIYGAPPPSSSTSTTTTSASTYLAPMDTYEAPRKSFEHPPGYVQNPYASNFSGDRRRAQAAQQDPTGRGLGGYTSGNSSPKAAFGVDPEAVWNTAKRWANTAGQKLQETEEMVWKRVNGEK
ncbi:MAG: hypothetical protein M1818_004627 [Claussenomyces sp. TS43310]|nr:MAG: hypothetical protein M1818_004627 [Claussenomyces sp. TS43310]